MCFVFFVVFGNRMLENIVPEVQIQTEGLSAVTLLTFQQLEK